jgi:urease accessory protein
VITDLEERGGYRAKFPRGDIGAEAVLINTGGGMLGGDRYRFAVQVSAGASATVASQSAERVYRALGASVTQTDVALEVGSGASLAWLPQETILFNGARLSRRISVEMTADASLLLCEAIVLGRAAMGETITAGTLHDRWSVHRAGRLVFAEANGMRGDLHAQLARTSIANGGRAIATLLFIAPDAEDRRDGARAALGLPQGRAALSAWNGMLVARFLAPDGAALRADLVRVVTSLSRRPMPRVWNC